MHFMQTLHLEHASADLTLSVSLSLSLLTAAVTHTHHAVSAEIVDSLRFLW